MSSSYRRCPYNHCSVYCCLCPHPSSGRIFAVYAFSMQGWVAEIERQRLTWSLCLAYPILALSLPPSSGKLPFFFSVNGSAHSHPSCPQEPIIGCVEPHSVFCYTVSLRYYHTMWLLNKSKMGCSAVKSLVTDTQAIISADRCTTKCVVVVVCIALLLRSVDLLCRFLVASSFRIRIRRNDRNNGENG